MIGTMGRKVLGSRIAPHLAKIVPPPHFAKIGLKPPTTKLPAADSISRENKRRMRGDHKTMWCENYAVDARSALASIATKQRTSRHFREGPGAELGMLRV
jgi:hypothetical protein